jgi:multiple sugar transport system substrate-binding protein
MKTTLALLMGATMLAAPLSVHAQEAVSGTVDLWVYPIINDTATHQGFWDGVIERFNAENPDVRVRVDIQPWAGRNEKFTAAVSAGRAPDLVYLIPDQIPQFVRLGALEPVSLPEDVIADYLPGAVQGATYEGALYTAPVLMSAVAPIYNKTQFADAGIETFPKTWDELKAAAPALKEDGVFLLQYGASLEETLNLTYYPLLWQAGGQVFAEDGKTVAFNSPEGLKALQFVVDMFKEGYADPSTVSATLRGTDAPMAQKRAAMQLSGGSDVVKELQELWGPEEVGVADPLTDAEQITYGTVGGFAMPVNNNDNAPAQAFLEFLIQPDNLAEFNRISGFFGPRASMGAIHGDDPFLSQLESYVAIATPGEVHPLARQVISVLAPEIQGAILGSKTPEQALADAERTANDLIAREGL